MRKLWAIIWKENYLRFTDRTGALYMFATPLLLSIIMGLAFSGLSGPSDVPAFDIAVGIVNLDEGSAQGDFGEIFAQAFIPADPANPDPDNPLHELFDAREVASVEEAQTLVTEGELTAALIIPPGFSAGLTPDASAFMPGSDDSAAPTYGHGELTIYWNQRSQIGWTIFRDVVTGIANGISTSNIAVGTTVSGLVDAIPANPALGLQLMAGDLNDTFANIGQAAADPQANTIRIAQVDVTGEQVDSFDPLAYFSPGFSIFFMGFTVTIGAASVLREQRSWTLQRMITTPTPRAVLLGGKMVGTYIGGLLQMLILILAMTLVGYLLQGSWTSIWGADVLGIALVTLSAVAAATGVGTLIAAFAKSDEHAGNMAGFILFVMGLAGGIFFPTFAMPEVLQFLPRLTFHFWGANGYQLLAAGGSAADVLGNVAALLALAVVFFGVGLVIFNRRLDI